MYIYQITYTLNIYIFICQLYLIKAVGGEEEENEYTWFSVICGLIQS